MVLGGIVSDLQRHRFWALVHGALTSSSGARLLLVSHNEVRIALSETHVVVILLDERPYEKLGLLRWLEVLLSHAGVRELDVLVLSEGGEVKRTLESANFETPWSMRLALYHMSEFGTLSELTKGQGSITITAM